MIREDLLRHNQLTARLVRSPGQPPSECGSFLVRVDGSGARVKVRSPWTYDDALAGEGSFGTQVPVALFRCVRCGVTLVVAECRNEKGETYYRLRNAWEPKHSHADVKPIRREVTASIA